MTLSYSRAPHTEPRLRPLEIRDVIQETDDAVTLVFTSEPVDYLPGQFLTLCIPSDQTGSVSRCYSLSSSPSVDRYPAVTVKRTSGGYASNWLCDNASVGMKLDTLAPAGAFGPRHWGPDLLLCAAGSGITPMLSIIKTALADHDNHVQLLYANKAAETAIFAAELAELKRRYPHRFEVVHWYEADLGLPTASGLRAAIGDSFHGRDAYVCGPGAFMEVVEQVLTAAGQPHDKIHREVFRSLQSNPFEERPATVATAAEASSATVSVALDGEHYTVDWPRDTVLLDALLEHDIDAPYVCRAGECGACVYRLIEGDVRLLANDTLDAGELADGVRLACQSVSITDSVRVVFD
ncbi:ferredoxin--NADP reductase [Mycobacteroides chelonae]|uniref:ferredoxin--NADP reductase n=1 Tax=Mycobacteroides chelonae TaxID=1774 RepID=UPI000991A02C|nr:ferredoxin--NADP reductase [Mycobacteroides chelonae]